MIESLSKRTDYPSLLDYNYLNQASLGLIGSPAVEAMNDFLYHVARHGNLKMSDEQEINFLNQEIFYREVFQFMKCLRKNR